MNIFDWMAQNWIGLILGSIGWFVLWFVLFLVAGVKTQDHRSSDLWYALSGWSLVSLWSTNLIFGAGVVGMVVALIKYFAG